ncbi:MAG: YigZ family protein [Clostridia bacterium]|nr:YigZ family protein [Clostridia bacterium]
MEKYKTISGFATSEISEKKSRFIGYVSPASSEEEAMEFVNTISKKHWDATHNVYAYKIRNNNISRCSDDGEPAKTAGAPILDVLEKEELTDLVVVVTRYFGGTLLGTGGLVKAYSKSAKEALGAGEIVVMQKAKKFILSIPYNLLGKYENEFKNFNVIILEKEFLESVDILGICKASFFEKMNKRFSEISNGQYISTEDEEMFFGFRE